MRLRLGVAATLVSAAVLAGAPAGAGAASPYIASSSGAGAMCTNAAPCSIQQAVLSANMAGDRVLLKDDGPYSLTGTGVLVISGGVILEPQVPGTRPTITSTDGSRVFVNATGTVLQDVRVSVTGLAATIPALQIDGGSAFRVEVFASGTSPSGVSLGGGSLLSDSTVRTPAANATAIRTLSTGTRTVRNVSVLATGLGGRGLSSDSADGAPQVVEVRNSILDGFPDIRAVGAAANDITVNVRNSNFDLTFPPPASPNAVINDQGGNQSAAPLLANPAAGDFTQLTGSPTIDAGTTSGGISPLDFSRKGRLLGLAPDIGADEFLPPPPLFSPGPAGPSTAPTKCKKAKKKAKKKPTGKAAAKCKGKKKKKKKKKKRK